MELWVSQFLSFLLDPVWQRWKVGRDIRMRHLIHCPHFERTFHHTSACSVCSFRTQFHGRYPNTWQIRRPQRSHDFSSSDRVDWTGIAAVHLRRKFVLKLCMKVNTFTSYKFAKLGCAELDFAQRHLMNDGWYFEEVKDGGVMATARN